MISGNFYTSLKSFLDELADSTFIEQFEEFRGLTLEFLETEGFGSQHDL